MPLAIFTALREDKRWALGLPTFVEGANCYYESVGSDNRESRKMGGRPCIRGRRIRVKDLLEVLAAGARQEEILRDHPALESEDLRAVLQYAAMQADHAARGLGPVGFGRAAG